MSDYRPKCYKSKVTYTGNVVEIVKYEWPVFSGFVSNERGRACVTSTENKEINQGKRVKRARDTVRGLVNKNASAGRDSFLTLTYSENMQDLKKGYDDFKKFMKRLNYKVYGKGSDMKYLAVPQFQRRGALHFHLYLFNVPFIPIREIVELWGFGFGWINNIKNCDNVGAYVVSYMEKEFERLKSCRAFRCSRNLSRPEVIKGGGYAERFESMPGIQKHKVYTRFYDNEHYGRMSYTQYNLKRVSGGRELEEPEAFGNSGR